MKQIDLITQGAGTGESYIADARICNTLKASHCKAHPMVCYAARFISRQGSKAGSTAYEGEVSPTLRAGMTADVVYCIKR